MPLNYPNLSNEEKAQTRAQVKNSGEIFIMDKDGSNVRNLTHNNTPDGGARWSKDGIYFLSQREGAPNVYVMNVDGEHVRKVADGNVVRDANVSPDEKYFAYSKDVGKKSGLYIYEIKSAAERRLIGE